MLGRAMFSEHTARIEAVADRSKIVLVWIICIVCLIELRTNLSLIFAKL